MKFKKINKLLKTIKPPHPESITWITTFVNTFEYLANPKVYESISSYLTEVKIVFVETYFLLPIDVQKQLKSIRPLFWMLPCDLRYKRNIKLYKSVVSLMLQEQVLPELLNIYFHPYNHIHFYHDKHWDLSVM